MATRKPTTERRNTAKPISLLPEPLTLLPDTASAEAKPKPKTPRRRKSDPVENKPSISVNDLEDVVSILSEFKKPKQTENEAKIELQNAQLHAWVIKVGTIAVAFLLSSVAGIVGYATVMEINVALPESVMAMLSTSKEIFTTIMKASE